MAIRLSSSSISSGGGGDANVGDGSDKRGRRKKKKKIPSYNYLMTLLVLVVSAIILLYASSSSVRNNNYTTNKDMIVFGSKAVMSSTISSSSDEPNNDDPSASLSPPYIDKHYCFIHIGKAAGSKVSCELGYRYTDCGKNYTPTYITTPTNTNRTANSVPNIINNKSLHGGRVHISHMNYKRKCLHDDIFLVTVRHPLTRLISWYRYEKYGVDHSRSPKKITVPIQLMDNNERQQQRVSCFNAFHNIIDTTYTTNDNANDNDTDTVNRSSSSNNGCFSTLNEFATNVTTPPPLHSVVSSKSSETTTASLSLSAFCTKLAWDVANGSIPCSFHNYYNYEYYTKQMMEITEKSNKKKNINNNNNYNINININSSSSTTATATTTTTIINNTSLPLSSFYPIVVIRKEHIKQDFDKLKIMFGDDADADADNNKGGDGSSSSSSSSSDVINKSPTKTSKNTTTNEDDDDEEIKLSKDGRYKLCYALCNEIQYYKFLINNADNLNYDDKEQSIKEIYDLCPESICV
jgi:hypothetical protein